MKLTADWDLRPLLQSYASLNFGGYADPETDQLLAGLCAAEPAGRAAAMTALCKKLADQAPIVPVCFKSYSVLLPAGAALQPITPTAANDDVTTNAASTLSFCATTITTTSSSRIINDAFYDDEKWTNSG